MKNAYQQLFREQDFIDRLIEARDSCKKTHAETGFTVARNTFRRDAQYPEDRDYVVNGVQFGDEGGINLSSENYGILENIYFFRFTFSWRNWKKSFKCTWSNFSRWFCRFKHS